MTRHKWVKELNKIKELGSTGMNMTQIAKHYGVSRQRMKQIVQKYIPDWHENYGFAVKRKEKADKKYQKWGVKEDTELYRSKRHKFYAKKYNALRSGRTWEVNFSDIDWPTHCPVLGMELDYFAETVQENSVSFDQHNPDAGYVAGNVVVMSWRANRIKNNGSLEEHQAIVDYLQKMPKQ